MQIVVLCWAEMEHLVPSGIADCCVTELMFKFHSQIYYVSIDEIQPFGCTSGNWPFRPKKLHLAWLFWTRLETYKIIILITYYLFYIYFLLLIYFGQTINTVPRPQINYKIIFFFFFDSWIRFLSRLDSIVLVPNLEITLIYYTDHFFSQFVVVITCKKPL